MPSAGTDISRNTTGQLQGFARDAVAALVLTDSITGLCDTRNGSPIRIRGRASGVGCENDGIA